MGRASEHAVRSTGGATESRIRIKRAYEAPAASDGYRVLIDRLWPRGLRKDQVPLDAWEKDLAVSDELRRWFAHDPTRWSEFVTRYRRELRSPLAERALERLADRARRGPLTIVYAARDSEHNNAVVVRSRLEAMIGPVARRNPRLTSRRPAAKGRPSATVSAGARTGRALSRRASTRAPA